MFLVHLAYQSKDVNAWLPAIPRVGDWISLDESADDHPVERVIWELTDGAFERVVVFVDESQDA